MKKKVIVIVIIAVFLILGCIPFGFKKGGEYDHYVTDRAFDYYYALLWQKDYYCVKTFDDGRVLMADRFRIAWFITVYNKEKMMMRTDNGLVPV